TTEANGALKAITVNSNAKIPIPPFNRVRGGAVDTEPANGPGFDSTAESAFVFKVPPVMLNNLRLLLHVVMEIELRPQVEKLPSKDGP
ncbi:hypothetical protein ACIPY2_21450, partial [Paenarthrobacter sp. NPDC089675]